jgi:hypothetical protein
MVGWKEKCVDKQADKLRKCKEEKKPGWKDGTVTNGKCETDRETSSGI